MSHPGAIAQTTPDKAAVIFDGRTRTYADLDARSLALANRLAAMGLQPGDVVALWANNGPDYLTAAWAAQRSGLYVLPVASGLTAAEVEYILRDSGAKALVSDRAADFDGPRLALDDALFIDPGTHTAPAIEGGDMMYTSGTTGRPKGVRRPLSHAPLGSDTRRAEKLAALFGFGQDTVFLSPAPLYHAAPFRFAMSVLRLGGTVVLMERFDARRSLSLLREHAVTHSQWVPTMFARLLALPEAERRAHHAPLHRAAIHAGAPCPPDVKRAMIDWWGPILHEYYSGTESIGFTHITSAEWLERPGSVGRPWNCTVHVLDESGAERAAGETGTVYFGGKGAPAYHNAPDKTAAARRGALATMGDIGHVDADGYLYLTDRAAFTIISGGVNVYPAEVEAVLAAHPDVALACVFGVPDPDFGEVVQAVVELRSDVGRARDTVVQELFAQCRDRLSAPKRPKRIAVDALPLTGSGKIAKAAVRARYAERTDRGLSEHRTGAPA